MLNYQLLNYKHKLNEILPKINVISFLSVQLYRARTVRLQCGDTMHGHRSMHHQESSGALLVRANASQAKILHRLSKTTR